MEDNAAKKRLETEQAEKDYQKRQELGSKGDLGSSSNTLA